MDCIDKFIKKIISKENIKKTDISTDTYTKAKEQLSKEEFEKTYFKKSDTMNNEYFKVSEKPLTEDNIDTYIQYEQLKNLRKIEDYLSSIRFIIISLIIISIIGALIIVLI